MDPSVQGMSILRIISGPAAGTTHVVEQEIVIGREGADLTIEDGELSRRHAAVRPAEGGVVVEDLGSMNGTFVNGKRISEPLALREPATIKVGRSELALEPPVPAGGDATPVADVQQATRASDVPVANVDDSTRARDVPVTNVDDATRARDVPVANVDDATRARDVPVANVDDVTRARDVPVTDTLQPTRTSDVPVADIPQPTRIRSTTPPDAGGGGGLGKLAEVPPIVFGIVAALLVVVILILLLS